MAHLNIDERFTIYEMHKSGYSSRMIAKVLGRDKSTVCYELKKNKSCDGYRPDKANILALSLRGAKRRRKIEIDDDLRSSIIQGLQDGVSPDVIAGRRKLENFPTVSSLSVKTLNFDMISRISRSKSSYVHFLSYFFAKNLKFWC